MTVSEEKAFYFVGTVDDLRANGFDVHEYDVYIICERDDLHGGNVVINHPLLDIEKEETDIEFSLEAVLEDLIKKGKVLVVD